MLITAHAFNSISTKINLVLRQLCMRSFQSYTLVMVSLVLCAMSPMSWAGVFMLAWVSGFACMVGGVYLGVQGVLRMLTWSVLNLFMKSVILVIAAWNGAGPMMFILGDYAAVSDSYYLQLRLQLDGYSLSYIVLTSTIGLWAIRFATNYMRAEPSILNFVMLLYFFLISMVLLLASGNFPTLMLGWEAIGCFSFLLINFWTTRMGTAKSAFKAFFFNKLSDAALIMSFLVFLIFLPKTFSVGFTNMYLLEGVTVNLFGVQVSAMSCALWGLVVCSFCKSAQLGLHVWLPDSMEAPVPASALIHSATLVSAGVFLLGRHEILTTAPLMTDFLLVWCSATALYGGLVAAYQTDLKKILAYSTMSHCGFLMLLVVYNNVFGLVLYLHLHGWFKSYSFMASGNIISKYLGYQDYRRMGGSASLITLEILVLTISISCLGGLPFLLGFFNKHYLLLLVSESTNWISSMFTLGAAFTGLFYTIKTVYSLTATNFKSSCAQKSTLVSGGSRIVESPTEPWTNIYLFGTYPLIITALSILVLKCDYWSGGVVYHSMFGIFFFMTYFISLVAYFRWSPLILAGSLFSVKTLYML